jgi:hypothetical protein
MLDEIHKLNLSDQNKYLWHYPPSIIKQIQKEYMDQMKLDDIIDPYQDCDLFVIIRNPYDRIISAYYHWETMHHPIETLNSDGLMNRLIGESLDAVERDHYLYRGAHYIPQYDFVYDNTPEGLISNHQIYNSNIHKDCKNAASTTRYHPKHRRIVKHVIRYDYLNEDFEKLMKLYQLNVTLSDKASSKRKKHGKATLTKFDISAENRKRIEAFYQNDFAAFGFPILKDE